MCGRKKSWAVDTWELVERPGAWSWWQPVCSAVAPLGRCPFSSPLCALIGHKCSCLMFGCLASFLLLLNVAWPWLLGSGVVVMKSHIWGGASFPVWTIMSGSGMFATNPHLCPPGRNWSWPDSDEEEELPMTLTTIGWWTSGGALCWTKCLNTDVN